MSGAARPGISRRTAAGLLLAAGAGLMLPAEAKPFRAVPTRGFALPGWVDRVEGSPPSPDLLARLRRLGFETIRLPVDPDLVGATDASLRESMLTRVSGAVGQAVDAGYKVIVDLHPRGDLVAAFDTDVAAASARAVLAWTHLREIVAAFPPDVVFAELLNEPPMVQGDWLGLRTALARTVRTRCPGHTLIWGPARYQGIWELTDAPPLADGNAIASVHYYWPMGFTHQCENWDAAPVGRFSGLPFPASSDGPERRALAAKLGKDGDTAGLKALDEEFSRPWNGGSIEADFAKLAGWSRASKSRVMLGEFGALGFCADIASRASWVGAVRRAAEANGVGWVYWEAEGGFGFAGNKQGDGAASAPLVTALLPRATEPYRRPPSR